MRHHQKVKGICSSSFFAFMGCDSHIHLCGRFFPWHVGSHTPISGEKSYVHFNASLFSRVPRDWICITLTYLCLFFRGLSYLCSLGRVKYRSFSSLHEHCLFTVVHPLQAWQAVVPESGPSEAAGEPVDFPQLRTELQTMDLAQGPTVKLYLSSLLSGIIFGRELCAAMLLSVAVINQVLCELLSLSRVSFVVYAHSAVLIHS